MDAGGRRLAKARLREGVAGIARLHAMIGEQLGEDAEEDDAGQVAIGIETDRGPWVAALIAAGYTVFGINPLQVSRYRERHGVSGARATRPTRTSWPIWCAPTPTSCGRWPGTPRRPRRSRW